jgi:hypothetical protein
MTKRREPRWKDYLSPKNAGVSSAGVPISKTPSLFSYSPVSIRSTNSPADPRLANPFAALHFSDHHAISDFALDRAHAAFVAAGLSDKAADEFVAEIPHVLGQAIKYGEDVSNESSRTGKAAKYKKALDHINGLSSIFREMHPADASYQLDENELAESKQFSRDRSQITSEKVDAELAPMRERLARNLEQIESESPRRSPSDIRLFWVILYLASIWMVANKEGPESLKLDRDTTLSNFVTMAYDILADSGLTTARSTVCSVTRELREEIERSIEEARKSGDGSGLDFLPPGVLIL